MNNENDYNAQLNNQNSNNHNNTNRPIKNKFFPEDIIEEANAVNVNASTSSNVDNQFISKKNLDIGNNFYTEKDDILFTNLFSNNTNEIIKEVNATIYNNEPEVLEPDFLNNQNQLSNNNINNIANNKPDILEENNQINQKNTTNYSVRDDEPEILEDIELPQHNTQLVPEDSNWINKQPLSMKSLGVSPQDNSNNSKEAITKFKFFNELNREDKKNNTELESLELPEVLNEYATLDEETPEIEEVSLLKNFIGQEFQTITMSPFSFSAFILGSVYFIFRKLYIVGIIVFLIEFILLTFIKVPYSFIALLVFKTITGLSFNQLYINISKRKIKKIKSKNPQLTKLELNNICKKNGQSNFLAAIIFAIITILLTISNILLLADYIKDYINKNTTTTEFNGKLTYENYDVTNVFNITIPSEFILEKENRFYYTYIANEVGSNNTCSISFSSIKEFTSGENLIYKLAKFYKTDKDITQSDNNEITWYKLFIEDNESRVYYRATTINNKAFLLEYKIGKDIINEVCDLYYVAILDSITLK